MGCRLLRRHGDRRHLQALANDFHDVADRHSLFSDRVIPGACLLLLQRQPVETGGIENVHRGQRLSPSPTYAETPFSRARSTKGVMRPCLTVLWTWGSRTTDTFLPAADTEAPANSEAFRGLGRLGLKVSSVAGRPAAAFPIPVPEVMIRGRSDPVSAAPRASMARLSFSQFATNFEKSWSKAQWITPSDLAAPRRRLSRSSRSPRCASAPAATRDRAPASDRVSPST